MVSHETCMRWMVLIQLPGTYAHLCHTLPVSESSWVSWGSPWGGHISWSQWHYDHTTQPSPETDREGKTFTTHTGSCHRETQELTCPDPTTRTNRPNMVVSKKTMVVMTLHKRDACRHAHDCHMTFMWGSLISGIVRGFVPVPEPFNWDQHYSIET